jgi:modification methylase
MLELNKIYCCDVLEGLKQLDDASIDLIITSPPYNKAGFNGKNKRTEHCIWNKTIDYSGNVDVDCMDEEYYEQWQTDILNECYRVLKDDGSMFYNHKIRVKKNQISHPLEWISKSQFRCRQIITWDRTASPNPDPCRYVPTTELIFWLSKTNKNPRFKRDANAMFQTEVWRFPADKNTEHPAPFPVALPDNIIPSVAQGERITVLDPFMGSGTVAISALKNSCNYIGFEISEEYCNKANGKLEKLRGD